MAKTTELMAWSPCVHHINIIISATSSWFRQLWIMFVKCYYKYARILSRISEKILMHREIWFFFCLIWQASYDIRWYGNGKQVMHKFSLYPFLRLSGLRFIMTFLTILSHTPIYRLWRNHFYACKVFNSTNCSSNIYINICTTFLRAVSFLVLWILVKGLFRVDPETRASDLYKAHNGNSIQLQNTIHVTTFLTHNKKWRKKNNKLTFSHKNEEETLTFI